MITSTLVSFLLRTRFALELMVFLIPFVLLLPRRKLFPLRIITAAACCLFAASFWTMDMARLLPVYILRYVILYLMMGVSVFASFQCSWWIALYCSTGAYAAQHLLGKILDLQQMFFPALVQNYKPAPAAYYPSLLLMLAVLFLVFFRTIRKKGWKYMESSRSLYISVAVVLCAVGLNAVVSRPEYADLPMAIRVVILGYDVISCVFALTLLLQLFHMNRSRTENEVLQQLWAQDRRQLELSRENMELINIKCHDIRHMMAMMADRSGGIPQAELDRMSEAIQIYDSQIITGCDALSLVLTEKSLLCNKNGIQLNCMAQGELLQFMEEPDVYSLFGNALDNAIAACQKLTQEDKRIISVQISERFGMISICIENYCEQVPDFENGLPVTTSGDRDWHGYGVLSIKRLTEKYHGEMSIAVQQNIFTLRILLPIPEKA